MCITQLNPKAYGLTRSIHSDWQDIFRLCQCELNLDNLYINRNRSAHIFKVQSCDKKFFNTEFKAEAIFRPGV